MFPVNGSYSIVLISCNNKRSEQLFKYGILEICTVIKCFCLKDFTETIKRQGAALKISWTSTNDEPCSGRFIEVTTHEMIEKIHKIVLTDRRVKISQIAEPVNISTERVCQVGAAFANF